MAFAPNSVCGSALGGDGSILGQFKEVDHGSFFEFSKNNTGYKEDEFPHLIWLFDGEYRFAIVKKTVAYIAVDEAADGSFVTEKWQIKNYRKYS